MERIFLYVIFLFFLGSCSFEATLTKPHPQNTDITLDTTAPLLTGIVVNSTYGNSLTQSPQISWPRATDEGSGILKYEIAIGSTSGGIDTLNWTDVGNVITFSLSELNLSNGITYYPSVRAIDLAGNVSSVILGAGWIVHLPPSTPTSLILENPTNTPNTVPKPTFSISGLISGYTVKLYSDNTCSNEIAQGTAIGTSLSMTLLTNLTDAQYEIHAIQNDGIMDSACSSASVEYWLDTVPAYVSIDSFYDQLMEGIGPRTITINVVPTKPYPITVQYNLNGTTADVSLHTLIPGSVIIPANTSSATVSYNVLSDGLAVGPKILQLNIEKVSPVTVQTSKLYLYRASIDDSMGTQLKVIQIGTSYSSACALREDNTLKCWGNSRKIGDGTTTSYSTPTLAGGGSNYQQVAVGSDHICAIDMSNHLWCWGTNTNGQVGDGTTAQRLSPTAIDAANTYSMVSTQGWHTCAIQTGGALMCWGMNTTGQVGDTSTSQRNSPTLIDGGTSYGYVSAGISSSCGVTVLGALKCWGSNTNGQIGDNSTTQRNVPTLIDSGVSYTRVSTSDYSSCGITNSGQLKCWGEIAGNNTSSDQLSPVVVDNGETYAKISIGESQKCGITSSNILKCWGSEVQGTGFISISALTPQIIGGQMLFKDISFGHPISNTYNFGCAITINDEVVCWGNNTSYQIGDGNGGGNGIQSSAVVNPTPVNNFSSYLDLVTGTRRGWTLDSNGQLKASSLSHGNWYTSSDVGFLLPQMENQYTKIFGGRTDWFSSGICALKTDGSLMCDQQIPDSGVSYTTACASDSSFGHICGITSGGVLKCWGSNFSGELGDGTTTPKTTPTVINSGTSYSKVSCTSGATCAITTGGALQCWGSNLLSRLGDGTATQRLSPVPIDAANTYSEVDLGATSTCGILTTGTLKCWGRNAEYQLGDGTNSTRSSPTVINGGTNYSQVSIGSNHTCAITNTGVLKCWGFNNYGQLGTGNFNLSTTPQIIDPGVTYQKVSSGGDGSFSESTCGITTTGILKCWGDDYFGSLGIGTKYDLPITRPIGVQDP